MSRLRMIAICAIFLLLCGCASYVYGYRGVNYSSSEQALKAQRDYRDRIISEISPTDRQLPYRALIVFPSRKLIEEKGLRVKGSPNPDQFQYVVSALEMSFDFEAEAIKRRSIFEQVSTTKSDNPEKSISPEHDVIIYLLFEKAAEQQWFLKIPSKNEAIPIYVDTSLEGSPRVLSWLNYIEKKAAQPLGR